MHIRAGSQRKGLAAAATASSSSGAAAAAAAAGRQQQQQQQQKLAAAGTDQVVQASCNVASRSLAARIPAVKTSGAGRGQLSALSREYLLS